MLDRRPAAGETHDGLGELQHAPLARVADVHRLFYAALEKADDPFDQIRDEAETASLLALAVNGELLAANGLKTQLRNDAAVVRAHARAVGIEDAHDSGVQ